MISLKLVLMILAIVCFVMSAIPVQRVSGNTNMMAWGLALWALATIVTV
jgi:hypothetical protein